MEIEDKKTGFKVIDGGLMESAYTSSKKFISAYVTDTRLMGVVTLIARWGLPDNIRNTEMYQFFYVDCTKGIQEYERVFFSEQDSESCIAEIKRIETRMTGGLGALRVAISQEELSFLLSFYSQYNDMDSNFLPSPIDEYSFLIQAKHSLSKSQESALMAKQCTSIQNIYQAVHYFIMRVLDRDSNGVRYLMRGDFDFDMFPELGALTVIKNTIDDAGPSDSATDSNYCSTDSGGDFSTFTTRLSYSCTTLACDDKNMFYLLVSQVTTEKKHIVACEPVSCMLISQKEASLIDSRPEYVTVFDFIGSGQEIDETSTKLLSRALVTEHVSGRTFMIYNTNNDHVKNRVFRLGDDVKGLYYILDTGQIVLSAYTLENIRLLERDITRSKYADLLMPATKYQFQERIMFEFINSEIQNFEDFVDVVAEDEDFIEDDSDSFFRDDEELDFFFEAKDSDDFYKRLMNRHVFVEGEYDDDDESGGNEDNFISLKTPTQSEEWNNVTSISGGTGNADRGELRRNTLNLTLDIEASRKELEAKKSKGIQPETKAGHNGEKSENDNRGEAEERDGTENAGSGSPGGSGRDSSNTAFEGGDAGHDADDYHDDDDYNDDDNE